MSFRRFVTLNEAKRRESSVCGPSAALCQNACRFPALFLSRLESDELRRDSVSRFRASRPSKCGHGRERRSGFQPRSRIEGVPGSRRMGYRRSAEPSAPASPPSSPRTTRLGALREAFLGREYSHIRPGFCLPSRSSTLRFSGPSPRTYPRSIASERASHHSGTRSSSSYSGASARASGKSTLRKWSTGRLNRWKSSNPYLFDVYMHTSRKAISNGL